MAIILGGITLNPNMIWAERFGYSPVTQEVLTTLGGTPIVYSRAMKAGMPITLLALQDQGWLTLSTVEAVQISANTPGAEYNLVIGAESFQVVFRHHDQPAVEMIPLLTRAVPLAGDYFIGQIKLMTIV